MAPPISSAPCRPLAATVSAGENFQSGKIDCTSSKPCATHSTQPISAASSMPGAGARVRPNTISGSMRGSAQAGERERAADVGEIAQRASRKR